MAVKIEYIVARKNRLTITADKKEVRIKIDDSIPRALAEDMILYFLSVERSMHSVSFTVRGHISSSRYLKGKSFSLRNNAKNISYRFDAKGGLEQINGEQHVVEW